MNGVTAKRVAATRVRDVVDLTSEDPFPASGPPSRTPVAGTGLPCCAGQRPMLIAPGAGDEATEPRRAVRHPTDYSDASRCAFEVACRLAVGGRVTVLHVPAREEPPLGRVLVPLGGAPVPYSQSLGAYLCPTAVVGTPALAGPAGSDVSGLPVGVRLRARRVADRRLTGVAGRDQAGAFRPPHGPTV